MPGVLLVRARFFRPIRALMPLYDIITTPTQASAWLSAARVEGVPGSYFSTAQPVGSGSAPSAVREKPSTPNGTPSPHLKRQPSEQELFDGVDVVFHLAGIAHQNAPASAYREVNELATLQLARLSAAAGVGSFVFLSSVKAMGPSRGPEARSEADCFPPVGAYARSKRKAEEAKAAKAEEPEDDAAAGRAKSRKPAGGGGEKPAAPPKPRSDMERRRGKLTISNALDEDGGQRARSLAAFRRRQERQRHQEGHGRQHVAAMRSLIRRNSVC
mgnify:CR=1 FL=1